MLSVESRRNSQVRTWKFSFLYLLPPAISHLRKFSPLSFHVLFCSLFTPLFCVSSCLSVYHKQVVILSQTKPLMYKSKSTNSFFKQHRLRTLCNVIKVGVPIGREHQKVKSCPIVEMDVICKKSTSIVQRSKTNKFIFF
jgi:hypothetical protein